MDNNIKRQVKPYLLPYLKSRFQDFKVVRNRVKCPFFHTHENKNEELTAHIFPEGSNKLYCFSPKCGSLGDVIDLYRRIDLDGNTDVSEDEIAEMLIEEFGIKINEEQNKLFDKYERLGLDMVPANKNGKESWIENDWQIRSHKDKSEWEQWISAGRNLGCKTGKLSNVLILDFDFVSSDLKKRIYEGKSSESMLVEAKQQWEAGYKKIQEKLPFLDQSTLQQRSFGGIHYFFIYDSDIPKTAFNYEGIHIDVESEGGQVIVEPSVVGGQNRQIIGDKINSLPKELKEFILANCTKIQPKEDIKDIIENAELTFENLNGNRNNTFIKLYGELRKEMPIKVAYNTLIKFNNLLDKKVPSKELSAMAREAEKYHKADIETLCEKILYHFKLVQSHQSDVSFRDLKDLLKVEITDIHEALRYLIEKEKIYPVTQNKYKLIDAGDWRSDFMELSKPLNVEVPYFNNCAKFNRGSLIVIGGRTGGGKSHLSVNMIEQFVKQGICPKLITTEADSGVGEIAMSRGLKEGDFLFRPSSDPLSVPFQNDEIRILDWLKAPNSEFYKLDSIYETLNNKLVDTGGLLIVLSQLNESNDKFYSEGMVKQYASLAAKFLHPQKNGQVDNLHPYFETCKIRRTKTDGQSQYIQIPLEYIPETKELRIKK